MVVAVVTVAVVGMTAMPPFDDHSRGIAVTSPICLTMPTIVIAANDGSAMATTAILLMMSTNRNAAWADFDLCHRRG